MALKPDVALRTTQKLALTDSMRRSLALLRMPALALREEIAREAAENPFLVVEDDAPPIGSGTGEIRDAAMPPWQTSLARQIVSQELQPQIEAAALIIAGELREDGYLDTSLEALSFETGIPIADFQDALAAVHRCEPSGIGARSLAECLELQLVDNGIAAALASALIARIEDIASERWSLVARALSVPVPEVMRLADLLRGLKAQPVAEADVPTETLVADLVVLGREDGTLSVSLADWAAPRVSLLPHRRETLQTPESRAMALRAQSYLSAVAERGRTLLSIGRVIVDRQSQFFAGRGTMSPLSRTEVAAILGLHGSTVGRAIWGKGLGHEGRVFPLTHFFTRLAPAGADATMSVFDVQRKIYAIIAKEDPLAPLADDDIRAHLKGEGVDIARRTVAKYRKCMRIAPSYKRRRR